MNTIEIINILRADQAVSQILEGVVPIDSLPQITHYPSALVVNLDPSTKPGSHWVALFFSSRNNCEYFDSYGRKPFELESYMLSNAKKYIYNNIQVQQFHTVTCGQMCIYFLIWRARGIHYKDIIMSMESDSFIRTFINSLFNISL